MAAAQRLIDKVPRTTRPITDWRWRWPGAQRNLRSDLLQARRGGATEVVRNFSRELRRRAHPGMALLGKHEFACRTGRGEEAEQANSGRCDGLWLSRRRMSNWEITAKLENAANWMMKLRGANQPAATRVAYFSESLATPDGALELMNMAYESKPGQVEDGAWISPRWRICGSGNRRYRSGGEGTPTGADDVSPAGYHYALSNLAKVRIQQKRYPEAVVILSASLL